MDNLKRVVNYIWIAKNKFLKKRTTNPIDGLRRAKKGYKPQEYFIQEHIYNREKDENMNGPE